MFAAVSESGIAVLVPAAVAAWHMYAKQPATPTRIVGAYMVMRGVDLVVAVANRRARTPEVWHGVGGVVRCYPGSVLCLRWSAPSCSRWLIVA